MDTLVVVIQGKLKQAWIFVKENWEQAEAGGDFWA